MHPLFSVGQFVASTETGQRYEVIDLLGEGGFGQVYLAKVRGSRRNLPANVCLKVSVSLEGWLRETYFARLYGSDARVLQIYDAFPVCTTRAVMYCLVLEYASEGDLSQFLAKIDRGIPEGQARREIIAILRLLDHIHAGRALHRDLTPFNVFVFSGPHLKIGDFGIARHYGDGRGVVGRTRNPFGAPTSMIQGRVRNWQAKDDLYQVGQLLAMLIKGSAERKISTRDVTGLPCSDDLKAVIHRCLSERRKRYESAADLLKALRSPSIKLPARRLKSLKGVHVTFTGILSRPRHEAARLARSAGATVHKKPSLLTSTVVCGRVNRLQVAGPVGGLKLLEVKRLYAEGHDIGTLTESMFWKLVGQ
jgi:serine/threonine protein kinase